MNLKKEEIEIISATLLANAFESLTVWEKIHKRKLSDEDQFEILNQMIVLILAAHLEDEVIDANFNYLICQLGKRAVEVFDSEDWDKAKERVKEEIEGGEDRNNYSQRPDTEDES